MPWKNKQFAIVGRFVILVKVCAITLTSVEVTLDAAVKDVKAADFQVALGDEAVAVKSVTLKEGTQSTYVLNIDSLDGKLGTLKVNGVESAQFDFSAAALDAAIAAVKAANAASIIDALQRPVLGLTGIDSELAGDYVTEIAKSFVDTRSLLQAAVDRVNTAATADLQAKIDAVKNAKGQTELLDALTALGIDRQINSLAYQYFVAISKNPSSTKAGIQGTIDTVNLNEVNKLVVDAETKVTDAAVATANALLGNFTGAELNDEGEDVAKDAFTARLAVVSAIVDVNDTVSATTDEDDLLGALGAADLGLEDSVIAANKGAYKAAVEAKVADDAGFRFTTVAQIQAFVNDINAKAAADQITAVNDAATEEDFLDALQKVNGLTGVNAANSAVYFEVGKDVTFKNVDDLQKFVTDANAKAAEKALVDGINNATKETINAAINAFVAVYENEAYINVGKNNRPEVVSTFWVNHGEGRSEAFKTHEEVSAALTAAVNEYQGYLNAINASTSVSQLRAAFNVMIDDLEAAYGDEITSKVVELSSTEIYNNGSLTIAAATEIYEALAALRSDNDPKNDNFATIAEAFAPAASLVEGP
ncbi:hypothetical protein ACI7RC_03955 [Brevibacillus sp. B_LB10_24]|uniref:hypothetical protein n=1 Tax=Brevibacillus sp. B_LB10_24 TaxID=3380645 RepID=UPI0038B886FF